MAAPAALLVGCSSTRDEIKLQPALSHPERDPSADLKLAASALASGNVELAETLYNKVLAAKPHSFEARLGLADTRYLAGDFERARVLYGEALAAKPGESGAQLGLARVALRQRRLSEAQGLYRQLLAKDPGNAAASEGLGTSLDLEGRHGEAEAVYREGLRVHPDEHGLRVDLGLSLVLAGRPREGVNVLLDVTGLTDAPWQARADLAFAYGVLGNTDSAKKILSLELPPSAVDDNLQLYRVVRERLGAHAATAAAPAAAVLPASAGASPGMPGVAAAQAEASQ
ncbi:tetratricopeptide repeat protein [Trinickia terrae]|uniref:Tetratricopeptide repeat protein n=2 Tax=Trinickia terrae TaxID=2571161 RepID=A0A4U1HXI0_9BURK|nr:tetratricopeptide repeat protein [Trinickia terrae]